MQLSPLRNPWNLATFGPITFELKVGNIVTQTCSGVTQTVTEMNTPANLAFSFSSLGTYTISTTYANQAFFFYVRNPVPSASGQMVVAHTDGVILTFSGAATGINKIILTTGVITQDYTQGGFIRVLGLSIMTPPSSRPFTLTLTT